MSARIAWRASVASAKILGAHQQFEECSVRTRFFILHNLNAGRVARHLFHATVARMRRAGAYTEIVETTRHGEGMRATTEAAQSGNFDALVAAGGDGTAHDAAEGLVGHSMPLGIIPMGTGNVFA